MTDWLDALAEDLRAAGFEALVIPPNTKEQWPAYVDAGELMIAANGEVTKASALIFPEDWPILRLIDAALVREGLAPAPESDGDLTIPFVPLNEYATDAVDIGVVEPVFALGCDFDEDEEGAGDA